MENQHRQISGYRELNEAEVAVMNEIKAVGPVLEALVLRLQLLAQVADPELPGRATANQRWVAIGATHLQQGLMALTRAVAQPTFF